MGGAWRGRGHPWVAGVAPAGKFPASLVTWGGIGQSASWLVRGVVTATGRRRHLGGRCEGPGGSGTNRDPLEPTGTLRDLLMLSPQKSEGQQPPEFRSFAVDPQITSLDVLQHILARAFDLQG